MEDQLGIAVVGLCGRSASTGVATIERLRRSRLDRTKWLLGDHPGLVPYHGIRFGGWDVEGRSVLEAAREHATFSEEELRPVEAALDAVTAWPGVGRGEMHGDNTRLDLTLRERIECIGDDLDSFRNRNGGSAVMLNLFSGESWCDEKADIFQSMRAFERAIDEKDARITPSMLYAYAAIEREVPYAGLPCEPVTSLPALQRFADMQGVPLAGRRSSHSLQDLRPEEAAPRMIEIARCLDLAHRHGLSGELDELSRVLSTDAHRRDGQHFADTDFGGALSLWLTNFQSRPRRISEPGFRPTETRQPSRTRLN